MATDSPPWTEPVAAALDCYDESLLRLVAARLIKPRNHWPVDELRRRCLETLQNPPVLDRRLQELEPAGRQVLALIAHSRQPAWALGNLVEMIMTLGHEDGIKPIFDLLQGGLLYPAIPRGDTKPFRFLGFEYWVATAGATGLSVYCPLEVARRALGTDLGLPDLSGGQPSLSSALAIEADGLDWLLRVGVLWQLASATPLRRTQTGGYFKRDAERLQTDPLLNAAPADRFVEVPDLGFLLASLAEHLGVLIEAEGEIKAGKLPAAWDEGLIPSLEMLWTALPRLTTWTPLDGWRAADASVGNPFPSACLVALLLLARLPRDSWLAPAAVQDWLEASHPYWLNESLRPSRQKPWLEGYLLGVAYPLKLVQVRKDADGWAVRLTDLGRWYLSLGEMPAPAPTFPQTLLVQPNLEILAYRQGLTTTLVGKLTRIASWKTLGAACTLQLEPETVYRALELGESFYSIRMILEQHGTRSLPPGVLDSLRTWSNKRDRITVFPAAAILEFANQDDVEEALSRGLRGIRVSDTVLIVSSEDQIDFKQFRLAGTRDYTLPPEKCVTVESDGVTLTVDVARSDLMLETELPRFAIPLSTLLNGKKQYRLTPASLASAREGGFGLVQLETWFQQRTGQALTPAARLLMTGAQAAGRLQRLLVFHVPSVEIADGLLQWPATRELISERLGPQALVVDETNLKALRHQLAELNLPLDGGQEN